MVGPPWPSPEMDVRIQKLERAVLVLVRTCDHLLKSRHTHPTDPAAQQIKPEQAR